MAVGCGKSHTLISTKDGRLFAFGNNADNQCGLDDPTPYDSPQEVRMSEKLVFVQLVGGSCHSVGLTGELSSSRAGRCSTPA